MSGNPGRCLWCGDPILARNFNGRQKVYCCPEHKTLSYSLARKIGIETLLASVDGKPFKDAIFPLRPTSPGPQD